MKKSVFTMPKIEGFDFSITYSNKKPQEFIDGREQHIHNECEIYVHLSGDVSFMVEDKIYPISPGNIVVTRPNEYHHCIYNSEKKHEHFWILFSCEGNENFLCTFFDRKFGEDNLLILDPEKEQECIELCYQMAENDEVNSVENYLRFFKLLKLLESADTAEVKANNSKDISAALKFISVNFMNPITVREVAEASHMSVNTLERRFLKAIKTTPNKYLREKRLANAVMLLSKGDSVTDTCIKSGFSDCSGFINIFKKRYGLTPLKYKQQINKQ